MYRWLKEKRARKALNPPRRRFDWHKKLHWSESREFEREEAEVVAFLTGQRSARVTFWEVVNKVSSALAPKLEQDYHDTRRVVLAVLQRLLHEKRVIRHRKTNTVRVSELF